jgi:hypothetical protein
MKLSCNSEHAYEKRKQPKVNKNTVSANIRKGIMKIKLEHEFERIYSRYFKKEGDAWASPSL